MSKDSKWKRRKWSELLASNKTRRGRHAADDTVVPIVPETPAADIDYSGRHRAPENPCAPFTSDAYRYSATYSEPASSSDSGTSSSADSGSSCGE